MLRARVSPRIATTIAIALSLGCAGHEVAKGAKPAVVEATPASGNPARPPEIVRIDPLKGASGSKTAGLVALEEELRRAMSELGKSGSPPPYFIGYEVHDRRDINISASEGALLGSTDQRTRALTVDVRVGNHALDSTHPLRGGFQGLDFEAMMGSSASLPLDDVPAAIRAVAWAETDRRYKSALERLLKIESEKKIRTAEEDPSDDFSREKPLNFVEPPAAVTLDTAAWEARVRRLSARFRNLPDIRGARVALEVNSVNRSMTNSEGSSIQTGRNYARLSIEAGTRAEDGMDMERHESFDAAEIAGLPDEATLARAADAIIADLQALRRAPLAEPFVGPAILEGKAAAVFFHEIFGHRVEGHRQKRDVEGQTFAKKVGEAVMPGFISVYDDPTVVRIGGETLNGFYRFDDEAVPAQRASLVEGGVLKNFLMGRSPTRSFDHSNGHGRRQEGRDVVARQGNLVVQPSLAVSSDELRRRLRDEARRQGKPFGLLFRDISGGFTNTERFMPQAFKVLPVVVYRVWADGRPDELLRGVDIVGTPLAALNKIVAAADDYQTFNGFCGAESGFVPVSATSPSLLVQQIEVERKEKGSDKPPVLSAPPAAARPASADPVRQAMEDELGRTMAKMHVEDQPRPHYAAYTVTEGEFARVSATFGAVTSQAQLRSRTLRSDVRVGDASFDSGNFQEGGYAALAGLVGGFGSLPLDDDYLVTRRALWLRTDEAYKRAVDTLAKKKASAGGQSAADEDKIPDFAAQAPAQTVSLPVLAAPETGPLRALATRLSALFQSSPLIAASHVDAMHAVGRQRFLASNGTWADERDAFVRLDVSATTQAPDGMRLYDAVAFTAKTVDELPAAADMEKAIHALAEELSNATGATIPESGTALVLFEGPAAGQIVKRLLAEHLAGTPPPKTAGGEGLLGDGSREFAGKIGQRIAAAFLSVYDDPRAERGPGKELLLGSYHADDEGVPAQKVSLIEAGVLKTLLMSRTPSKEVARSNGHGRSSQMDGVKGHIANLFVTAKGGLSRQALLNRLAKESKARHCEAYIVRLVDDPTTAGGLDVADFAEQMFHLFTGGRRGGGAAPVLPLVAYRLKNGKEEPVRGFTLEGMVPKALKDIVAAGRDPFVLNFIDGLGGLGLPSAIVSPSLLFADIEVRRQTSRNKKPPLYPHPSFAGK
jgi:predicted Zn-dependent protease